MTEALRDQLHTVLATGPRLDVIAVGKDAGVPGRIVGAAIAGRPIAADFHLRLCAAFAVDPAPDLAPPCTVRPAAFDHALLGMGVGVRRRLNGQSLRKAGLAMGISRATVMRLERGDVMSIGVVVKACRFVGVHPFGYLKPYVSRETRTVTVGAAA